MRFNSRLDVIKRCNNMFAGAAESKNDIEGSMSLFDYFDPLWPVRGDVSRDFEGLARWERWVVFEVESCSGRGRLSNRASLVRRLRWTRAPFPFYTQVRWNRLRIESHFDSHRVQSRPVNASTESRCTPDT